MGKMKELSMEQEEKQQQEDHQEFDVVMEEAHYEHTIKDFVSLIEVYGWNKVQDSLIEKLLTIKGAYKQ